MNLDKALVLVRACDQRGYLEGKEHSSREVQRQGGWAGGCSGETVRKGHRKMVGGLVHQGCGEGAIVDRS